MSNYNNDDLERLSDIFKALSNINRLKIFLRLSSCCEPGSENCGEEEMSLWAGSVGQDMGIAPSTVSHHLKELRRVGLVRMERQGKRVRCWTEPKVAQKVIPFLSL